MIVLASTVSVGAATSVALTANDEFGNLPTGYAGTVKITRSDTALTAPVTAAVTSGKLLSLMATFNTAGSQTLTFTDSVDATLKATASTTVSPFELPTATITRPTVGQTISGRTVPVTAHATVPSRAEVSSFTLSIDGTVMAVNTTADLSFDWDTSQVTNGTHTIRAVVVDSTGASGTSAEVTVTVENVAGCGCSSTPQASALFALAALARTVVRRRRGNRAS